jgi:hypothetical protein
MKFFNSLSAHYEITKSKIGPDQTVTPLAQGFQASWTSVRNPIQTRMALRISHRFIIFAVPLCVNQGQWLLVKNSPHCKYSRECTIYMCHHVADLKECWGCVRTSSRETSHNTIASCRFLCNEDKVPPLLSSVAFLACNILWLYAEEQVRHSSYRKQQMYEMH